MIPKGLVLLDGAPFKAFSERREDWKCQDYYWCPGPLQFSTGQMDIPLTLKYELMPAGGTDPDPHVPFATQTAFGSHPHRPTPDFCLSALEKGRLSYTPSTPACLRGPVKNESMGESQCARPKDTVIIQQNFQKTYRPTSPSGTSKPPQHGPSEPPTPNRTPQPPAGHTPARTPQRNTGQADLH